MVPNVVLMSDKASKQIGLSAVTVSIIAPGGEGEAAPLAFAYDTHSNHNAMSAATVDATNKTE